MFVPHFSQPPEGWPFNELESALQAVSADASRMPALWQVLLRSQIYAVAHNQTADEPSAAGGSRLIVFTSDREQAIMAFSSHELARLSILEPTPIVHTSASQLVDYLGEVSLILNPSGPFSRAFRPAEIRAALSGVTHLGGSSIHVANDTPVTFGELSPEPMDLIDSVTTACRLEPSIHAVYLCSVCVPGAGDTAPYPLIGIDAEDYQAARKLLSRAIGSWTTRSRLPVAYVDMRTRDRFSTHLRSKGKRIYRRAGWLRGLLGG
jgi:hypothetical protein